MKISTKGRYAVRVMIDLAVNDTGEYMKVNQIAKRQGISEKYLEQIIGILNRADFVKSTRGAQGGYKLTRPPEAYTVGMILRLTEGSLSPVACLEDDSNGCERSDTCQTIAVWRQLEEAMNQVVDHITVGELARKQILAEAKK